MNRATQAALCAAAALLAFTPAAYAEDFNITVPLDMSNLPPNIAGIMVSCAVITGEPRLGGRYVGNLTKRVDVKGGAFRGNVTINFNATAGLDPALVTHYECSSSFVGDERGVTVHYFNDSFATSSRFPVTAGAPFRLKTGVLPIPR